MALPPSKPVALAFLPSFISRDDTAFRTTQIKTVAGRKRGRASKSTFQRPTTRLLKVPPQLHATATASAATSPLSLSTIAKNLEIIASARARSFSQLNDLKAQKHKHVELNVTSPLEILHGGVGRAIALDGRVDVLVHTAGYVGVGSLKENMLVLSRFCYAGSLPMTANAGRRKTYARFGINAFGPLNVTRAFLPSMRAGKSGTAVWLGSMAGRKYAPPSPVHPLISPSIISFSSPLANGGLSASTRAVNRSFAEALNAEIAPLGLSSFVIEAGGFRTAMLNMNRRPPSRGLRSNRKPCQRTLPRCATSPLSFRVRSRLTSGRWGQRQKPGDPRKAVARVADLVRGDGVAQGAYGQRELLIAETERILLQLQAGIDTPNKNERLCSTESTSTISL
ncbi:hypothetical protein OF83DRAFT_1177006 [Amylostereum chailletii]|nr:hypothetical protein OF83DRAFT_1177006 [Amylostereum chailletii]